MASLRNKHSVKGIRPYVIVGTGEVFYGSLWPLHLVWTWNCCRPQGQLGREMRCSGENKESHPHNNKPGPSLTTSHDGPGGLGEGESGALGHGAASALDPGLGDTVEDGAAMSLAAALCHDSRMSQHLKDSVAIAPHLGSTTQNCLKQRRGKG